MQFSAGKIIYDKLGNIPKGRAGDTITEGCLVLEGGAFRGLYTQGFLDVLMEHDINFRCVIGVSRHRRGAGVERVRERKRIIFRKIHFKTENS
ncbi:MAG: hypothetical protein IJL03_02175 [Lachnospiraceae bacterium]|nr:hypothetical protein [Lachnospiraceae bacterium]